MALALERLAKARVKDAMRSERGTNRRKAGRIGVASFFAGIGGIDLGLEEAGLRIVYQCEIDEFCNSVLARHWPGIKRATDIREVHGGEVPNAQVWCAGFPCQDVSLARARERKGLKGKNTGLFYEFARLLADARPQVVLLENVPGLLSSHDGKDFAIVLGSLGELGYGVAWRVFDSQHFGVPQSRKRLFITGCLAGPAEAASLLFESECGSRDIAPGGRATKAAISPFKEVVGDPRRGPLVQRLGYCLAATSGRHTGTDWSRTYVTYPDAVRRLTPLEAERLQGFPDGWTLPPDASQRETESLDSARYAAIGNAVTVPVAHWIGFRMAQQVVARRRPAAKMTGSLDRKRVGA